MLSKVFDVSINTLLGSPRKLICQCCGMPLEDDDIIGHNHDGSFNEDYCKWCYADGTYTYNDMDDLIEVMERYGAYNAANLDGGTSSVLVVGDTIVNDPIDSTGAHKTRPCLLYTSPSPRDS